MVFDIYTIFAVMNYKITIEDKVDILRALTEKIESDIEMAAKLDAEDILKPVLLERANRLSNLYYNIENGI